MNFFISSLAILAASSTSTASSVRHGLRDLEEFSMTFDAPEEMKKGSGSKKSKCGPEEFSGAYTYITPVGKPYEAVFAYDQ